MRTIKKNLLIILIILVATLLRFYKLDSYPALNADEAAIGYNAYSLIQTGKDEHGNTWPVHFQSFNDYKPGLYFYLVLPFVKVLGLNEWAVRLPGAALGVLTVLVVYLLVNELFPKKNLGFRIYDLGFIASFLLAISPWHIHFSRGGWEVNAATFLITAGVWLFLKGLKNSKYYLLSAFAFLLSLYTYHAARIVVPLLGAGLVFIYCKDLIKNPKSIILTTKWIIPSLFIILLLIPLVKDLLGPAGISRAAGVGLFADVGPLNRINEQRGEHFNFQNIFPRLIHNKAVNYGLAFFENWGKHYWGEFLFLSGDEIQRNRVPETGQMYLFDILFLAVGLISIAKLIGGPPAQDATVRRGWFLVLFWLAVAPMGAALTFQSPHALRSHNMVIPITIISAYGLTIILDLVARIKKKKLTFTFYLLIISLITWQFVRYVHMYYIHMAKEYPFSSQYGIKELASYVKENQDKYQKIWVTDRYDQPYILFLFYMKYSSQKFQGNPVSSDTSQSGHVLTARDQFGFSTVRDFDKFHFQSINFDKIRPENPNTLIIGTPEEIPKEANVVKEIYGTNGHLYFKAVAN